MTRRVVFLLALGLLGVTLAGCSANSGSGAGSDGAGDFTGIDVDATSETGVILGTVFNEAIVPLANVSIRITGTGPAVNATTNEVGSFGVDGLAPGSYFVEAAKAGYQTVQQATDVEAGVSSPQPLKFQLVSDPASQPYSRPYKLDGFLQCSARVVITAYPCTAGLGDDVFTAIYDLDRTPDWIQSEMVWESTQSLGDQLSLVSECFPGSSPDPCPDGSLVVNRSEGLSPLVIAVNRTLAEHFWIGNGSVFNIRVFAFGRSGTDVINEDQINGQLNSTTGGLVPCIAWPPSPISPKGCFRFTGAGVILQQKFVVYSNVFYGYTPPADWRFIDNSEVPDPE